MLRNFIQARPKLAQGSAQERGFLLFFFHDGLSFSSSVHPSLAHPMSFQSAYSLSIFFFFCVCYKEKTQSNSIITLLKS